MNIIISGYGKMGTLIEARSLEKGWNVPAVIDPVYKNPKHGENITPAGSRVYSSLNDIEFDTSACTALDFTHPDCVLKNITQFASRKIPLVVGTTGWYDKLNDVKKIVTDAGACLLWAGNFSLGINLFYKLAEYAAAIFDKYDEYDCAGYEFHHNKKADSPSGTAKIIAQKVLEKTTRKNHAVYDKLDSPPAPDEFHFASLRCGSIPGIHALVFDSAADTIEIKHTARSRDALVSGALFAARYLADQAAAGKSGIWTFEDVLL
ncbi:MAG: 4-hydroxy-tetrahydrodipicolinate reductase [Spirochaetaceae bacterium]|jgi:4-hydroxy-tetrahydrodipicolinate reductase|nr:4-hydroxy-tetrahydrodipicolinate reductase [Spirochaetaceae bacterium]